MRLGIMQPYFFPYIGYLELIYRTEQWVVFDSVQYIRHGWVNRNRILHPRQGWQYVIVPTRRHAQTTLIKDISIVADGRWRDKLLGQLLHYRKRAPFFDQAFEMVSAGIEEASGSLLELNIKCMELVCAYLGIPFRYSLLSDMDLTLGPIESPGDWALRISEALGASEYVNAAGGKGLFENSKFEAAGIRLTMQKPSDFVYDCDGYVYEPDLSIIDVIMWNSPGAIHHYLESRLLEAC